MSNFKAGGNFFGLIKVQNFVNRASKESYLKYETGILNGEEMLKKKCMW